MTEKVAVTPPAFSRHKAQRTRPSTLCGPVIAKVDGEAIDKLIVNIKEARHSGTYP